jgi:diketogulonate reductase-like aldo/keto reductase
MSRDEIAPVIDEELLMATSPSLVYKLNNGVDMPALGLGVFRSEPEKTVAAVKSALDVGYRLIDTAAVYKNEKEVGEGLRMSGVAREDVFVTTKVWLSDYGFDQTLRAFDRSVAHLGIDVLDLYLVHWPAPSDFSRTIESYRAAMTLLDEGRVRAIGVSNFRPEDLDELMFETGHVPAVNQVELHPFFNQAELRKVNQTHGIVTQAWSPIGGINRYGAKAATGAQDPLSHPAVVSLARKYGKTPAQIILRWHIDIGTAPIPKSVRAERIAENGDVFDFQLSADDVRAMNALDKDERGGPNPSKVDAQTFASGNWD